MEQCEAFDFIYAGSIIDHVGLANIISGCGLLLKTASSALVTEAFHFAKYGNRNDYAVGKLLCPSLLFPILYGVRLAEDVYVGASYLPQWCNDLHVSWNSQLFYWLKSIPDQNELIALDASLDVKTALERLVSSSCPSDIKDTFSRVIEFQQSTQITLMILMQRLKYSVVGGMPKLLTITDNVLQNLNREALYNITWEALCWAFGERHRYDKLLLFKVIFNSKYFILPDPKKRGFSEFAFLLIDEEEIVSNSDQVLRYQTFIGNKLPKEVIRLHTFNSADNSFTFCIRKRSFENLPTGTVVGVVGFLPFTDDVYSHALIHLKQCGILYHAYEPSHRIIGSLLGHCMLYERLVCQESEGRYDFEISNIPNGDQRMTLNPEFLPANSLLKTRLHLTINIEPHGHYVGVMCNYLFSASALFPLSS